MIYKFILYARVSVCVCVCILTACWHFFVCADVQQSNGGCVGVCMKKFLLNFRYSYFEFPSDEKYLNDRITLERVPLSCVCVLCICKPVLCNVYIQNIWRLMVEHKICKCKTVYPFRNYINDLSMCFVERFHPLTAAAAPNLQL